MQSGPILDNHLHLDPRAGQGTAAVDDFARAGGTHMLIVNRPSWSVRKVPKEATDFEKGFLETISIVEQARNILAGRAYPVLGVHPALISRLVDNGYTPNDAAGIMQEGIEVAADYVAEERAIALKSGRPHYEVSDAVWDASNEVLRHALACAARTDCAIQLHTEGDTNLNDIVDSAREVGLPPHRIVKHFANGTEIGPVSSVIARREPLERAIGTDRPFLMETDYLDDPDRPGAVLGPKLVPRRVKWMRRMGEEDAIRNAHVDTPKLVYGIDTVGTLNE